MRLAALCALAAAVLAGSSSSSAAPTYVMAEIEEPASSTPSMIEEAALPPVGAAAFAPVAPYAQPRFAQQVPTPASGPYGQYGYPYSAFPPIPPPMPTYLPPPPYTPQPLQGNLINGQVGQQMSQING